MADEFKHKDYGVGLSREEWEDILAHIFDSQATGDIAYASSATQLSRLAKGAAGRLLGMGATIPAWLQDIDVPGSVMAQAQPCFLAYNSLADDDVTGDGTAVDPVDLDTEVFDVGDNFAADTFTAPTTGKYLLTGCILMHDLDGAAHAVLVYLRTSNRAYRVFYEATAETGSLTLSPGAFSVIADMDANDTVTLDLTVTGGAKVVDITGGGSPYRTWMSGYLLAS